MPVEQPLRSRLAIIRPRIDLMALTFAVRPGDRHRPGPTKKPRRSGAKFVHLEGSLGLLALTRPNSGNAQRKLRGHLQALASKSIALTASRADWFTAL